jgi:CBS domain-containing protein
MSADGLALLATTHPFSSLPQPLLREAASRSRFVEAPVGDELDIEDMGVVVSGSFELLVEQTLVDIALPGDALAFARAFDPMAREPRILALEDSRVLLLPEPIFRDLLQENGLRAFFEAKTRRWSALEAASRQSPPETDPFLRLAVKSAGYKPPLFVPADSTLAEAARRMHEAQASACLIGDAADPRGPAGILTERDALKALGEHGASAAALPVSTLMSNALVTVNPEDALFEAFAKMARHNIRRLVVVGANQESLGVIQERDLLSARGENPIYLSGEIAAADSAPALARCLDKARVMALRGVAESIDVERVGRLISAMHDQILERAVQLTLNAPEFLPLKETGFLERCAIVALGSEGRGEQFLATDQDNALVLADMDEQDTTRAERFACACMNLLLAAGFPACPHKVMLDNPAWRRSLAQWRTLIDEMARAVDPAAVLKISLLVDCRCVVGDARLAADLRSALYKRVRSEPVLVKYIAREALRFSPPLSFFNALTMEKSGPGKGGVDLKKGGVFPIVQAAKAMALDHGLDALSTTGRLDGLFEAGALSERMTTDVKEAYRFLQTLRVRAQAEKLRARLEPDNYAQPDRLSHLERDRLRDCFKIVLDLQTALHNKYGLRLMT